MHVSFKHLCPNLIPKHNFSFTFYFFNLSQTRSFVYHFRPPDSFTVFLKRKLAPPNGHFSNGKHYQAVHQPSVSQLFIQVTLYKQTKEAYKINSFCLCVLHIPTQFCLYLESIYNSENFSNS